MTLVLELPPDVEAGLNQNAAQRGEAMEAYVLRMLATDAAQAKRLPDGGMDIAGMLKDIVGALHEEDDPNWAENAEENYRAALLRRHAEGHV